MKFKVGDYIENPYTLILRKVIKFDDGVVYTDNWDKRTKNWIVSSFIMYPDLYEIVPKLKLLLHYGGLK